MQAKLTMALQVIQVATAEELAMTQEFEEAGISEDMLRDLRGCVRHFDAIKLHQTFRGVTPKSITIAGETDRVRQQFLHVVQKTEGLPIAKSCVTTCTPLNVWWALRTASKFRGSFQSAIQPKFANWESKTIAAIKDAFAEDAVQVTIGEVKSLEIGSSTGTTT